jgi:RNA polymerase sigma-70 factor (ECF subfamily)
MRVILSDASLALKRFQQGEENGFQYFFNKYYASLCHYAHEITSNQPVAEEIASDAFIKLWERRERFFMENTLRSFLYTVVRNAAFNYVKSVGKVSTAAIDDLQIADGHPNYFTSLVTTETYRQLHQAIEKLPKVCRKVITMFYIQGMSYEQIAQELQISLANIRNQKARGIKLLRENNFGVVLVMVVWMLWG